MLYNILYITTYHIILLCVHIIAVHIVTYHILSYDVGDKCRALRCIAYISHLASPISLLTSHISHGRFPKFHRVCFGRDPGTLKSDIVPKKHPQLFCSDLRLSSWKFEGWNYGNRPHLTPHSSHLTSHSSCKVCLYIHVYIHISIYPYIYIYRERERCIVFAY